MRSAARFAKGHGVNRMGATKTVSGGRNYGVDLLRILSMFYVIILHCLGKGGILDAAEEGTALYASAWFMEAWAYCAVNIFGMISGYVGYSDTPKKTKYSTWMLMWLQVVFYGAATTVAFQLILPDAVTKKDFFEMFLPVSKELYWYFTAYTALFFLMPLLNAAIRGCTEKQLKQMLIIILAVFVFYDNVTRKFGMEAGYTCLWLILLYLIGAIMKKCRIGEKIKPLPALLGIVALVAVSWRWRLYGREIKLLGVGVNAKTLVAYTSPTMVFAAMLYIIGFSKISFPRWSEKLISFMAKGAFAVYLLNNQRFIWKYVMDKNFVFLTEKPAPVLVGAVLTFALCFVVVAILIDHVRMFLFRILGINTAVQKLSGWVEKGLERIKDS